MEITKEPMQGIIFDKDGTLFDYRQIWGDSLTRVVRHVITAIGREDDTKLHDELLDILGFPPAGGINPNGLLFGHSLLRKGLRSSRFIIRHRVNPFRIYKPYKEQMQIARQQVCDVLRTTDFTHVQELFKRLKDNGYKIGIVTTDSQDSCRSFVELMGLTDMVDFMAGKGSGLGRKPNPKAMRVFSKDTGIKPQHIVMVGDSSGDMLFGKRGHAGYIVAVLTGSKDIPVLQQHADAIYPTVDGLNQDPVVFP